MNESLEEEKNENQWVVTRHFPLWENALRENQLAKLAHNPGDISERKDSFCYNDGERANDWNQWNVTSKKVPVTVDKGQAISARPRGNIFFLKTKNLHVSFLWTTSSNIPLQLTEVID